MNLTRLWIFLCAWLCAAGWVLSALHALNGRGYLVALAITIASAWWFRKNWWPAGGIHGPNWRKLGRRFRRPAPLIFLIIAVMVLASGLYHSPENGDSNAYRIPRTLHWLSQSGWHWIRTEDSRQNIAGCGYEWLCAPLILLNQDERWFFLPNVIAYFLLPGLLFSCFRHMKIASRAAWWWSWLVATGWCYTLQACSTENDSLASVYALAALVFALRARANHKLGDLWLAVLAAAVLSCVKPTNLPLLLPCLVALAPSWRLVLSRPLISTGWILFATLASFLPMAFLNWHYTGSWKGYLSAAGPVAWWHWGAAFSLPSPFWGIVGNTFYLIVQNLLPPFFPWAGAWNEAMHHFMQTPLGAHFIPFESFGRLNRSVTAASAGLGLSLVMLLVVSFVAMPSARKPVPAWFQPGLYALLCWTPWLALVVFMAKQGACQNARYLAAYYPLLLLPLLRRPGMAQLVRSRWWQSFALLVMAVTLAFMVFEYGRQLVPESVVARLQASPHRPQFLKVLDDYYRTRVSVESYRAFATRHAAGETLVGYATICGGLEPGMWQPWGHDRVERILPDDSPEWVRSRGFGGVFIEDSALTERQETIEQWLEQFNARVVDQMTYTTDPGRPPTHFYFCRLNESSAPPDAAPAAPQSAR